MTINVSSTTKPSKYATKNINILATNVFFLITLSTQITDTSSKVVDHAITNDHESLIYPGIIKADLTDHYPIICLIDAFTFSKKAN